MESGIRQNRRRQSPIRRNPSQQYLCLLPPHPGLVGGRRTMAAGTRRTSSTTPHSLKAHLRSHLAVVRRTALFGLGSPEQLDSFWSYSPSALPLVPLRTATTQLKKSRVQRPQHHRPRRQRRRARRHRPLRLRRPQLLPRPQRFPRQPRRPPHLPLQRLLPA